MSTSNGRRATFGTREFIRAPDGVELAVREWGNPDGPEILLVHGVAQCHLSFERQTNSFLAERYRIISYDLRGHGESEKPFDSKFYQTSKAWADDVEAVMDAKRLRRPILVGWSLGGRVVRQYLMHYGDGRLSGINFLSCRPIEDIGVIAPGSAAILKSEPLDLAGRLLGEIAFLRKCYEKQPDERDLLLAVAFNMMVPRPIRDAIAGWTTDPDVTIAALNKITAPTLISHGRKDNLILPRAAEMTAAQIRHASLSWYDDCGHSPFYEDAPRYNQELSRFVTEAWKNA